MRFSLLIALTVLLVSFFIVYALHPESDRMYGVKHKLDSLSSDYGFGLLEDSHMRDVAIIVNLLAVLTSVLIILFFYYIEQFSKNDFIIASIILCLLFLLVIVNFDFVFLWVHKIFFPQGNWMFPSNSPLILLYPYDFFLLQAKKLLFFCFVLLSLGFIQTKLASLQH